MKYLFITALWACWYEKVDTPPVYITHTLSGEVNVIWDKPPLLHFDSWQACSDTALRVKYYTYRVNETYSLDVIKRFLKYHLILPTSLQWVHKDDVESINTLQHVETTIPVIPIGRWDDFAIGDKKVVVKRESQPAGHASSGVPAFEVQFNYNAKEVLTGVTRMITPFDGPNRTNLNWTYHYNDTGKLIKISGGESTFIQRIYDSQQRLKVEVYYSGRLTEEQISVYHDSLYSVFLENRKRSLNDIAADNQFDKKHEVFGIVFYTYSEDGKLAEVMTSCGSCKVVTMVKLYYNERGLLERYVERNNDLLRVEISYTYDAQLPRLIAKKEHSCPTYGGYECRDSIVFVENYQYDDKGLMSEVLHYSLSEKDTTYYRFEY